MPRTATPVATLSSTALPLVGPTRRLLAPRKSLDLAVGRSLTDRPNNAAGWAPRCPQAHAFPAATNTQSEDCLYLTIWAPSSASQNSNLPVYVYVPGGSNIDGSAADDGIDGASMASQGLVVVHAQTRIGVLGFLPPSWMRVSDPNFALRDMLLALRSIKDNIVGAGGNPSAVTLGGQSSGALIAQSMLGVPEAAGLFQRIILQSGPMNVGTQSAAQTSALQKLFYEDILHCHDKRCAQNKSAAQLMTATANDLVNMAPNIEGVPYAAFVRPVFGTPTLPKDPSNVLMNNPAQLAVKPQQVLVTTVLNDGGAGAEVMTPIPGGGPLGTNLRRRGKGGRKQRERDEYYQAKVDALFMEQWEVCRGLWDVPDDQLGPYEDRWYGYYETVRLTIAEWHGWDDSSPEMAELRKWQEESAAHDRSLGGLREICPVPNAPAFWDLDRRNVNNPVRRDYTPAEAYLNVLRFQVGSRADAVAAQYPLPAGVEIGPGMTPTIERAFTDGGFRCPSRALAAKFATFASTYVGEFTQGGNHANNQGLTYCDNHVCHMDDVYAWWGTGPTGSDAFSQDVQGRVASFVKNGNPGSGWSAYNGNNVFAIGGGLTESCPAGFWGGQVKFDFQLYSQ